MSYNLIIGNQRGELLHQNSQTLGKIYFNGVPADAAELHELPKNSDVVFGSHNGGTLTGDATGCRPTFVATFLLKLEEIVFAFVPRVTVFFIFVKESFSNPNLAYG